MITDSEHSLVIFHNITPTLVNKFIKRLSALDPCRFLRSALDSVRSPHHTIRITRTPLNKAQSFQMDSMSKRAS